MVNFYTNCRVARQNTTFSAPISNQKNSAQKTSNDTQPTPPKSTPSAPTQSANTDLSALLDSLNSETASTDTTSQTKQASTTENNITKTTTIGANGNTITTMQSSKHTDFPAVSNEVSAVNYTALTQARDTMRLNSCEISKQAGSLQENYTQAKEIITTNTTKINELNGQIPA